MELESEESECCDFFGFHLQLSLMIQWELDCQSGKQKRKNQLITEY